jgi:hypothetical protein
MKNITSIPITFEVNGEISNSDTRFLNCTIDVLHTGTNFNGSVFSKEVVEENIETIKNTPILGFIQKTSDEEDFSGHEYIITKDKNGIHRKNIGSAWGVVPESCNPRWYSKTLDTGEEVEMLQVDALLWSKLEDSRDIMLRDIEKAQSMELNPESIDGYEDPETGLFHFTKFSFEGCTILGKNYEPAMQDANITINFTVSDFVKNIQSELINKYSEFTKLVNDTTNQDFTSLNMVDEKFNGGVENMEKNDFAQTILAQFSDISTLVSQHEKFTDRFGDEYPRYYTVDIQENEVIVVDAMNNYNYFAFSFTMNGDKPEIDFEKPKRKKVCYEDYVEGETVPEGAFDFGKHIAKIEDNAFTKVEEANAKVSEAENKVSEYETKVSEFETAKNEIEEKFNQVNAEFEEMKPKYEDYVRAEQARIEAELDAQKDTEFAKYETVLADDVNFAALKEKKAELTVKEIESECAILFARKNLANTNFSKSDNGIMTAGIIHDNSNDGFVETKYGCIPVRH